MSSSSEIAQPLPFALGGPLCSAEMRLNLEDFVVEERLGFEPDGEHEGQPRGEHLFLYVEKRNLNTAQVASTIARWAAVKPQQVSYSGLKDKRAITRQWFSVQLPGQAMPDLSALELSQAEVSQAEAGTERRSLQLIEASWHRKKLRRGVHRANRFEITLRNLSACKEHFAQRLQLIASRGVPNYFGEQRFGRDGDNVSQALRWFAGELRPKRHLRSLYLSAARSYLFNQLLAERVRLDNWDSLLAGDCCLLAGSRSQFRVESIDADLQRRLLQGDIHPSGPLFGRGSRPAQEQLATLQEAEKLEQQCFSAHPVLCQGLEKMAANSDRRALRVIPADLQYEWLDADPAAEIADAHPGLKLSFELPKGCFATAVVRELVSYPEALAGAAQA